MPCFLRPSGRRIPQRAKRCSGKAESLLLQAAPVIPIYYYTHVFLMQPSVQGWYPNLLDHHPYKYVWLGADPSSAPETARP